MARIKVLRKFIYKYKTYSFETFNYYAFFGFSIFYVQLLSVLFYSIEKFIYQTFNFILFYFAWFITSLIIKATHNYWNIDMDTSLCAVILPTNLFYSINYITLFIDKGSISVFFILILLIENMLLEILRFIIPNTKIFEKNYGKLPKN